MKKIFLIVVCVAFFSCKNEHAIVKLDDEKTMIIQKVFENVEKEDSSYLQEVFDESMIMINSKDDTLERKQFFDGIKKMYESFDNISFEEISVGNLNNDAEGSGVETNYYENGTIWTSIWSKFSAVGKHTQKEVSFPFHICYKWKGNKIIEEYQYFDTTVFEEEMDAGPNGERREILNYVNCIINNKTDKEIKEFCEKYQKTVNRNEPNTLAWGWFRTGKRKVTLIERYRNEDAFLNHINNISPGGIMEKDIASLFEHFKIEKMTIHGDTSTNLKSILSEFRIPTVYSSNISSYSR